MRSVAAVLAALCLSALLYLPAVAQPDPAVNAVLGASWFLQDGPDADHATFSCSATPFRQDATGTWFLTAWHCTVEGLEAGKVTGNATDYVALGPHGPFFPVSLVARGDDGHDWAVLKGAFSVPSVIPLGPQTMTYIGEPIVLGGFPYGYGPIVTSGTVSGLNVDRGDMPGGSLALYVYGAPGSSGSAVVDRETMTIIGVLVAGVSDGLGSPPLTLATPVSEVHT